MKHLIMQFSPTSCYFIPLRSKYIPLSTLFSNTFCLCSSLNIRGQVSYQYKTTGKIIVLNIQLQAAKEAQWWGSTLSIPSFLKISSFVQKLLRMIHGQVGYAKCISPCTLARGTRVGAEPARTCNFVITRP
jgi:hypothetical protein